MDVYRDLEKRIRERWPEDPRLMVEVPVEERSHRRRREFRHVRASAVIALVSLGGGRVRLHLADGQAVLVRSEIGTLTRLFRRLGYPFIPTHRQVSARLDRVSRIEQA